MKLKLRILRFYHDSRFIEINVKGPEIEVEKILQGFDERFNVKHIPDEIEIRITLQPTKIAIVNQDWRVAELNAGNILKPDQYDVIATICLGIARAAQGFEPEG
ncbi:hypothetical protein EU527_19270 [Candidatus Thorarchaeota archaeon]|nr:MAG: hypothetical protein EU527_19270 [Candidatus Thorarchaeota archaeon]